MLEIQGIDTGYGKVRVLHGLSLSARAGEILCVMGRNGAGKTTALKAIMGLLPLSSGTITLDGQSLSGLAAHEVPRKRIGYVPQGRRLFAELTVAENIEIGLMACGETRATRERVLGIFPRLGERLNQRAETLSGGEQQMLAIARILRTGAKFLLLDEPTEGLAPVIVQQIGRTIKELKREGFTIVLVEQNFRFAASVADRHYVVEQGRVIDMIPNADRDANAAKLQAYLGV